MSSDNQPVNDNDLNSNNDNNEDKGPNMGTLLIVAAVIVGISWFVATTLRHFGGIQDCVMQGRSNCVTINK